MKLKDTITEYTPELLMALGLVGMAATCVITARQVPKAIEMKNQLDDSGLTTKEYRKEFIKKSVVIWGPVTIAYLASAYSIVKSSSANAARGASIAIAGHIAEVAAFSDYREAVTEVIGKDKEEKVREVFEKKRKENAVSEDVYPSTYYKYYDAVFGPNAVTSKNEIEEARIEVNSRLIEGENVPLADFYESIGIEPTKWSYEVGWSSKADPRQRLDISYYSKIENDGTAVGYFLFKWWPDRWFDTEV